MSGPLPGNPNVIANEKPPPVKVSKRGMSGPTSRGFCGHELAANAPVAAASLVDHDEGDRTHVLAFDLDKRVCDLSHQLLFLLG
jgi:hypothetical protein